MSKNTVKPALTHKRSKRVVETGEFDGFVRRILAAYARRVADGDVEALRSLVALSAELDAVTRVAVAGLRAQPYAYSWQEIADRLGVTKQAAQQRYGERSGSDRLDRRLLEAGLAITVATLVEVFADHHPGSPRASACPACGFRYPDTGGDCPSLALTRPLLFRRRSEDRKALSRLTHDQFDDLTGRSTARSLRAAARQTPSPTRVDVNLFDLVTGEDPTP